MERVFCFVTSGSNAIEHRCVAHLCAVKSGSNQTSVVMNSTRGRRGYCKSRN